MRRSQGKGKETATQGRRFLKVGKLELGDCKGGKRQAGVEEGIQRELRTSDGVQK